MTFKEWAIEIFKDERGSISVKPVIAFVGALFLCGTMTANSFSEDHFKPAAELVNAVMVITAIGMGADTLDKFTKKAPSDEPKKEEELG
jgi:ATP/ADP translocase